MGYSLISNQIQRYELNHLKKALFYRILDEDNFLIDDRYNA